MHPYYSYYINLSDHINITTYTIPRCLVSKILLLLGINLRLFIVAGLQDSCYAFIITTLHLTEDAHR